MAERPRCPCLSLQVSAPENVTFSVYADDGLAVYLDGQQILTSVTNTVSTDIVLQPGVRKFVITYLEAGSWASWSMNVALNGSSASPIEPQKVRRAVRMRAR
jgi:hypothetical protein